MIPDLATLRDIAPVKKPMKIIYGMLFDWGWRGSARHWHRLIQSAYLLLGGLGNAARAQAYIR